jgi:hypothetical protein
MSSSEEESDEERASQSESEEEERGEDEEEEDVKEEEETKEKREDTERPVVERPLEYGLKRIDRISRWIDFLRNRMGTIYDIQVAPVQHTKNIVPVGNIKETKTNVPALTEDKRFQAALDSLLG